MFNRFSVLYRILAGFGVIVVLLGGVIAFNQQNAATIGDVFGEYQKTAQQTLLIDEDIRDLYITRTAISSYMTAPSEENFEAVEAALNITEKAHEKAKKLFEGDASLKDEMDQIGAELMQYRTIFESFAAIDAEMRLHIEQVEKLAPEFEANINEMLFTARITADRTTVDHGNAATLAFIRGLSAFRSFMAIGDEGALKTSGPMFAQAVSRVNSAQSHLERREKDLSSVEASQKTLSAFREALKQVEQTLEKRNEMQANLDEVGPRLQAKYDAVLAIVIKHQDELGEAGAVQISSAKSTALMIGLAVMLTAVLLALMIGRMIARAIMAQVSAMSRLADGDVDVVVQGAEHNHELGKMAQALKVFQDNARRMQELNVEKENADRQATQKRKEMMGALQASFGSVVGCAVKGDFSARVNADFPDAELNELAEGVNRLLETVDSGIAETCRVMARISHGDLSDRMNGEFSGSFAQLKTDVNETITKLSGMISELSAHCRQISLGSGDISNGAKSLSSRASDQASALEQTAATMERMSNSVKDNADNVASANNLTRDASQRADNGGQIVRQAIEAMSEIESSSGRISDIISVIDSIAFQTNLLALNAAVEAARAGDSGKGFAVVAAEVRTLAQRSSEAARDIRGLIEDSSTHVTNGVQLVEGAGDALTQIVASIKNVEETMSSIAQSSQEQASGVTEISSAVNHLDDITQKNAVMAEQSASKASTLLQGAEKMQELVGVFSISNDADAPHSSAA